MRVQVRFRGGKSILNTINPARHDSQPVTGIAACYSDQLSASAQLRSPTPPFVLSSCTSRITPAQQGEKCRHLFYFSPLFVCYGCVGVDSGGSVAPSGASERTSIEACRNVPRIGHFFFLSPIYPLPLPLSFFSFIHSSPFFHTCLSFLSFFWSCAYVRYPIPFLFVYPFFLFTGLSLHLLLGVEGGRSYSFPFVSLRNPQTHPHHAIFF